ncbi:MAG TPA: tryptophanase, partial [Candidatus Wallbacteria bacterium]|nr:tryptophanase [Candidatus Wallbacteria bacterium]
YFIRTREDAYKNVPIIQIVREMFSYANGATMSCKKDAIVNIGGFVALNSPDLYQQCTQFCVIYEGFVTYGGLSGRDLAAIAQGLYDGIDYEYLKSRIYQTEYLGKKLREAGVPIIWPIGGHAVYVNAREFLPHIPKEEFTAQALVVQLYIEGGIRSVEIGTVLADRDPITGENRYPELDLVRLAIPRRTYTLSHMDVVVDAFEKVKKVKEKIRGLRFTYEPKVLRHFTARFEFVS